MRTQVSPLPLDDVLFPLDDIFSKHTKCLPHAQLGLGVGGEGRCRPAVKCPAVGSGPSCSRLPGLPLPVHPAAPPPRPPRPGLKGPIPGQRPPFLQHFQGPGVLTGAAQVLRLLLEPQHWFSGARR